MKYLLEAFSSTDIHSMKRAELIIPHQLRNLRKKQALLKPDGENTAVWPVCCTYLDNLLQERDKVLQTHAALPSRSNSEQSYTNKATTDKTTGVVEMKRLGVLYLDISPPAFLRREQ